jgi:hypothetical protein
MEPRAKYQRGGGLRSLSALGAYFCFALQAGLRPCMALCGDRCGPVWRSVQPNEASIVPACDVGEMFSLCTPVRVSARLFASVWYCLRSCPLPSLCVPGSFCACEPRRHCFRFCLSPLVFDGIYSQSGFYKSVDQSVDYNF